MLLLILLLRLYFISASCFNYDKVHSFRTLKIEAYRKRIPGTRESFCNRLFGMERKSFKVLMELYGFVETGNTIDVGNSTLLYCTEIFTDNEMYSFNPAEWAIVNNKTDALVFFLKNSLLKASKTRFILKTFNDLSATCIKLGKYSSFKFLRELSPDTLASSHSYMILAARHHVNEEFWRYLFDERVVPYFVTESSIPEYYGDVLTVAVRFNNALAARMLIEKGAVMPEALLMIIARNRQRLLENVISSKICEFKDKKGLGVLHYAAKYSNDPDMITLILQKCLSISPDVGTASDRSPLDICLDRTDSNVETIARALILNGADIFIKRKSRRSPLEMIISCRMRKLFSIILGIYFESNSHMIQCIDMCISYESWSLLDEILKIRVDLIDSLNIQIASVYSFTIGDAPITFRYCLKKDVFLQNEVELIEWLIQKHSDEFTKIALDCGINHDLYKVKAIEMDKRAAKSNENRYASDL